jgi:hypothetical protein
MAADFSEWIPKQDACEQLGYTERTLERRIQKLKLRTAQREVPGRRSITVIHPADFERLKQAVIPTTPSQAEEDRKEIAVRPALPVELRQLIASLMAVSPYPPRALFLNLKEASAYTGLSQSFLRRLMDAGTLKAQRDRGLKIPRKQLDELPDRLSD